MREGFALHGPHAVAAGHAAVRLADDPGDDGPARGAGAVPHQGPARRRPGRPRAGAGRVRHRRCGRLAGDGVVPDAAPLPDPDEPACGASAACRCWSSASPPRSGSSWSRPFVLRRRCSRRRWSSGARCSSAGSRPHMLGRVASLDFFVSVSLMPVSMALAGPVSEAIGLRATFAIAGHRPDRVRRRRDLLGQAARRTRSPTRCATTPSPPNPSPRDRLAVQRVLLQVPHERHRLGRAEAQRLGLGEVGDRRRLRLPASPGRR